MQKNPNDVVVLMLIRAGGLANNSNKYDKKAAKTAGTKKSAKEQGEFLAFNTRSATRSSFLHV